MSRAAKMAALGLTFALGFAGFNKVDSGEPNRPAPPQAADKVTLLRVPDGGIQPQAVTDADGILNLIYFKGKDAGAGDLFYVRREQGQERFSDPVRVNSKAGSACAAGSVRGGQLAIDKSGRLHVAWNSDGMAYARLNALGTAFEEQRDLMQGTELLDGGGTVAADNAGNVYVAWHAVKAGDKPDEQHRQLWIARSTDDGVTFAPAVPAWTRPTGACACCSTRAFADSKGYLYLLYRSAQAKVNRDMYLLSSNKGGEGLTGTVLHKWRVPG